MEVQGGGLTNGFKKPIGTLTELVLIYQDYKKE
jgi:hypothetical protein